jgi:hypothetical protein
MDVVEPFEYDSFVVPNARLQGNKKGRHLEGDGLS